MKVLAIAYTASLVHTPMCPVVQKVYLEPYTTYLVSLIIILGLFRGCSWLFSYYSSGNLFKLIKKKCIYYQICMYYLKSTIQHFNKKMQIKQFIFKLNCVNKY